MERVLSEKGHELCKILKGFLTDKAYKIGIMLRLTLDQTDPDTNYQKLIDYLKQNPCASRDEIFYKAHEIIGEYIDDEEEDFCPYFDDEEKKQ